MQNSNSVARALEEVAGLLEFAGEPKFKVRAYRHAARVAADLGDELGAVVEQARLQEIEGIGPALSAQIEALWNTGTSELLSRLQREHPEGARELLLVDGLTPKRIRSLHAALGIRNAEELRSACRAQRVRTVPGFGPKTELRLLEASERYLGRGEAPQQHRIVLPAALELASLYQRALRDVADEVALAGPLRRGVEVVSHIDLVFSGDVDRVLGVVRGLPHVLRLDPHARVARLSSGVELRLHHASAGDFGGAHFRHTGSEAHVLAMRRRAESLDRSINEAFPSEAALYGSLNLPVVPPELRSGATALEVDGFGELVTLEDLVGMVHCHTTYSDGRDSVLDMALAAHSAGMQYITITDHSPGAHYARGVSVERLKEQWEEIAAVQERVPIRILRGTEADILADGSLDVPDSVLERLDVVIASIHARHRMDAQTMTARLVRAMSLPLFKIWGHGLGRILLHRDPIECDVPRVLDALAGSRGAIEINSDPHRLDLPPEWLPAARERGIPFVISADAHSTRGMGVLRHGVTMARRGGVRAREVLNTQSAELFADLVRPL